MKEPKIFEDHTIANDGKYTISAKKFIETNWDKYTLEDFKELNDFIINCNGNGWYLECYQKKLREVRDELLKYWTEE